MAVEVKNETNLPGLAELAEVGLDCGDLGAVGVFLGGVPLAVEVFSGQVGAVVSENNSVGVYHGDHHDDIVFKQKLSLPGF